MTTPSRCATFRPFRLTAFAAGLTLLAGCDPIGGGTGPVSLTINGPDGTADAATGTIHECIRTGVTALLSFDNGSVGDFTNRVVWTSSNPAVVRVANLRDTLVPGSTDVFFGGGVLTPVAPGTARITASFSGFTDVIDITVRPLPDMVMEQRDIGTGLQRGLALVTPRPAELVDPDTQLGTGTPGPATRQRLGPLTSIDLTVTADLDGVPTRVDPAAQWSFDAAPTGAATPNTGIATINGDGEISTVAANARPLVARASFDACGRSIATAINVAPIQSLSLVPEFGAQPLIVPNTERFFALADFGDGPEQDISATISFTSGATGTGSFLSAFIGLPNLLSSVAANATPILITATTPDPDTDDDEIDSVVGTTTQTVVADTLIAMNAIRIEPQNPVVIAGSSMICPLRVIGTYASGTEQEVTRRASYTSATPTVAQVSSVPQTAGQVSTGGRTPGTSVITATIVEGTTTRTATTTYTLVAPGTPRPVGGFCGETLAPLPFDLVP